MGKKPLLKRQRMRSSKEFTSRVHVADICQALKASLYQPPLSEIYNVVDEIYNVVEDCPAPWEVVFEFARAFVERRFSNRREEDSCPVETVWTSGKRDEKRVSNAVYKQGLQSIIEQFNISA